MVSNVNIYGEVSKVELLLRVQPQLLCTVKTHFTVPKYLPIRYIHTGSSKFTYDHSYASLFMEDQQGTRA